MGKSLSTLKYKMRSYEKSLYTKVKTETTSLMWLHTDNKMRKLVILIFLPSLIVLNCLQYTKALVYLNV